MLTTTTVGSGTYYIQITDANGCTTSEPVNVVQYQQPTLVITDPAASCDLVDLTDAAITNGSSAGTLSYFADAELTTPLTSTTAGSGTYYIQITDANGCSNSAEVEVEIQDCSENINVLSITDPCSCGNPNNVQLIDRFLFNDTL